MLHLFRKNKKDPSTGTEDICQIVYTFVNHKNLNIFASHIQKSIAQLKGQSDEIYRLYCIHIEQLLKVLFHVPNHDLIFLFQLRTKSHIDFDFQPLLHWRVNRHIKF